MKDLIVIRSANYACHEIETVVAQTDGVLPTFVAACSEYDAATGSDELVVFCALTEEGPRARSTVLEEIGAALSRQIGLWPRRIVTVDREAFPKTSAGKVQRHRLLADPPEPAPDEADPGHTGVDGRPGEQARTPWLFEVARLSAAPAPAPAGLPAGAWVVFDHGGLATALRDRRDADAGPVVAVIPGSGYERCSASAYRVDPAEPDHYSRLLAAVEGDHGRIGALVHAWATDPTGTPDGATEPGLDHSVLSLHRLIRACGERDTRLIAVTTAVPAPSPPPTRRGRSTRRSAP